MTDDGSLDTPPDDGHVERHVALMSRIPKLSAFTPAELVVLAQDATERTLPPGVDIYVEGAVAESFAIVVSGTITKRGMRNKQPLGPDTVVGTLPLLRRAEYLRRRTASLLTLTDVVLLDVPYAGLDRLLPERKEAFLDGVAEEALTLIEKLEHPE